MTSALTINDLAEKLDAVLAQVSAPAPRFLHLEAASTFSSLSVESLRRLIASGQLQPLRPVRGRIVLDRLALEQFILSANARPRKGRGIR